VWLGPEPVIPYFAVICGMSIGVVMLFSRHDPGSTLDRGELCRLVVAKTDFSRFTVEKLSSGGV
jgi:hypothetical protein